MIDLKRVKWIKFIIFPLSLYRYSNFFQLTDLKEISIKFVFLTYKLLLIDCFIGLFQKGSKKECPVRWREGRLARESGYLKVAE